MTREQISPAVTHSEPRAITDMLRILIACFLTLALTACAVPDDGSEQDRPNHAGLYIGGSGGAGF